MDIALHVLQPASTGAVAARMTVLDHMEENSVFGILAISVIPALSLLKYRAEDNLRRDPENRAAGL